MPSVLLFMEGGHKTLLAEQTVTEVEHALTGGRENGLEFVYLQSPNIGDNGFAVDPNKVVAVARPRDRDY